MTEQNRFPQMESVPPENFKNGIVTVDLTPGFGPKTSGKVRDIWVRDNERITVTTDRTSAFDKLICTVSSKGAILNKTSEWWFDKTQGIIPNHMISTPHVNVLISQQAEPVPVEMIVRAFMAKSYTSTSLYYNYFELGRRRIYGIDFSDNISPNEILPTGPVVTPTTKADQGHDLELDEDAAREIADKFGGKGTWEKMKNASKKLFDFGSHVFARHELILADTKYEFGIDRNGQVILIDEIHTSDSSRIWRGDTYGFKPEPEGWDKEILRRWLSEQGFRGDGPVPKVDPAIIRQMSAAYEAPYFLITGNSMGNSRPVDEISQAIINYYSK